MGAEITDTSTVATAGGTSAPLRAETEAMLDAVNALRLDDLRALVDDDYGIVDVDPQGDAVVLDTKAEWDAYMEAAFAGMRAADARLSYDVVDYSACEGRDLAYSVVRFRQTVGVGDGTQRHTCVATIVWKRTPDGWREARWHCTREATEVLRGPQG